MIGLLALAAAAAASDTPDRIAIQAVHNYGACVADRSPDGARELLAMDFHSRDYDKKLRRSMKGHAECFPFNGRLASSRLLFAGAMAEALLKSEVRSATLPQQLAYDPARAIIAARSPSEAMALCTVLQAPEATARIFATEPATPEEITAMKPLGSVLPECLKKDMKVELNKPALRSLLALAAYRIATTPTKAAQ